MRRRLVDCRSVRCLRFPIAEHKNLHGKTDASAWSFNPTRKVSWCALDFSIASCDLSS
jgi:hypothetical protein